MAEAATGWAPSRTALAGNPSDGYGGAIVTVALEGLGANARACVADRTSVSPPARLVDATINRFERTYPTHPTGVEIAWETSIPEGVGLAGSSAITIAVARALASLHGIDLELDELVAFALAVEREDLGIAGGRQDQVVAAFGGLLYIDFSDEVNGRIERLDGALLPPLVVAWRGETGKDSGPVHADLRARWQAGSEPVRRAMGSLAELAADARGALLAGDHRRFGRCVDETFDLRAAIMPLDPRHVAMIECARGAGASGNYSGSGGAIAAVCRDSRHAEEVSDALRGMGCGVLPPTGSPSPPPNPTA